MNRNYREGTWFAVPLELGGFAIGVVAKAADAKPVILCYFFGPKRNSVPALPDVEYLKATDAVRAYMISDLALFRKEWPIIGQSKFWNRSEWPMPIFLRHDPFRHLAWRVYYSDADPGSLVREEPAPYDTNLEKDSTLGAKATEIVLTNLLDKGERPPKETLRSAKTNLAAAPSRERIEAGTFRERVLLQLRNFGSDVSKPHRFDFYLYFPSETSALEAAKKIRKSEFTVEVLRSAHDDKWLCRAKKTLVAESAPLDEINDFFERIAAALHGEFDGWESDVVKDDDKE